MDWSLAPHSLEFDGDGTLLSMYVRTSRDALLPCLDSRQHLQTMSQVARHHNMAHAAVYWFRILRSL